MRGRKGREGWISGDYYHATTSLSKSLSVFVVGILAGKVDGWKGRDSSRKSEGLLQYFCCPGVLFCFVL